jgi:hypothetical protein
LSIDASLESSELFTKDELSIFKSGTRMAIEENEKNRHDGSTPRMAPGPVTLS